MADDDPNSPMNQTGMPRYQWPFSSDTRPPAQSPQAAPEPTIEAGTIIRRNGGYLITDKAGNSLFILIPSDNATRATFRSSTGKTKEVSLVLDTKPYIYGTVFSVPGSRFSTFFTRDWLGNSDEVRFPKDSLAEIATLDLPTPQPEPAQPTTAPKPSANQTEPAPPPPRITSEEAPPARSKPRHRPPSKRTVDPLDAPYSQRQAGAASTPPATPTSEPRGNDADAPYLGGGKTGVNAAIPATAPTGGHPGDILIPEITITNESALYGVIREQPAAIAFAKQMLAYNTQRPAYAISDDEAVRIIGTIYAVKNGVANIDRIETGETLGALTRGDIEAGINAIAPNAGSRVPTYQELKDTPADDYYRPSTTPGERPTPSTGRH